MRVYITPKAARDIDAIADWTLANWGEAGMKSYVRNLYKQIQKLASNPDSDHRRNDRSKACAVFLKSHIWFSIQCGMKE